MSGNSITMRDPIAFFITWPTYGTWLPGDERGWVVYTSASRTIATGAVELVGRRSKRSIIIWVREKLEEADGDHVEKAL